MDLFEHNEWTDGAMDDLLMEYRHNVSAAKTVYSVRLYFFYATGAVLYKVLLENYQIYKNEI